MFGASKTHDYSKTFSSKKAGIPCAASLAIQNFAVRQDSHILYLKAIESKLAG
jgi:hypothetical protein